MNRKVLKYAFIAGVAIGAIAAVVLLVRGNRDGKAELSPEQTVEAFCKAVAGGDFEKAYGLCDTAAMEGYIKTYRKAAEDMALQDSSVTAIAMSLLSQIQLSIDDVVKDGDTRTVFYTLTDHEGRSKQKVATTIEEGAWRVKQITDRN